MTNINLGFKKKIKCDPYIFKVKGKLVRINFQKTAI